MSASSLLAHLERGGILARRFGDGIQFLAYDNGVLSDFGAGNIAFTPEQLKENVISLPESWVAIPTDTDPLKVEAKAREMLEGIG